jgi:hypothetical protein
MASRALFFSSRSQGPCGIKAAVDPKFLNCALDDSNTLNPVALGFIPKSIWDTGKEVKFGDLVTDFFQRKNNGSTRFHHKLYNALKITGANPEWFRFVGVTWISPIVLRVDKRIFAQLLGIKTVDGSLFHQQGNFPTHGFVELSIAEARGLLKAADVEGVDFDAIRLLVHGPRKFVREAREEAIENCRRTAVSERT